MCERKSLNTESKKKRRPCLPFTYVIYYYLYLSSYFSNPTRVVVSRLGPSQNILCVVKTTKPRLCFWSGQPNWMTIIPPSSSIPLFDVWWLASWDWEFNTNQLKSKKPKSWTFVQNRPRKHLNVINGFYS